METPNTTTRQVFNLLRIVFIVVPVVAGLDKFTNILTDWEQYLNPSIAKMLPTAPHNFMMIVGVIEIIAGIIVAIRAELGGYIVAAWLLAIALTLLAGFIYLDIAVRDIVMAISAFSMARLSRIVTPIPITR